MYECVCVSVYFLSFSQFSIVLQESSAADCLIWFHPSVSVFGEGSFLLRVYEEMEMIVPGSESKPEKKGLGKCRRRNRFTGEKAGFGGVLVASCKYLCERGPTFVHYLYPGMSLLLLTRMAAKVLRRGAGSLEDC